jgi:hypothetical protein
MSKPASPAKLLERDVTRQHKDYLEYRGWRMIRFQRTVVATPGGAFSTGEPGMPDYAAVRYLPAGDGAPGSCLVFWLELKRQSGGRLGEHQWAWRRREEARGAVVACSHSIEEFDRWYCERFGWLHGRNGVGQQSFLSGPEVEV